MTPQKPRDRLVGRACWTLLADLISGEPLCEPATSTLRQVVEHEHLHAAQRNAEHLVKRSRADFRDPQCLRQARFQPGGILQDG